MIAEAVEKAVGRQVDVALGIARRNPPDRARRDDGVEGIVPEAVALGRLVIMQVFLALGVHSGSSHFSSLRAKRSNPYHVMRRDGLLRLRSQ